jgi:hypothetical protein
MAARSDPEADVFRATFQLPDSEHLIARMSVCVCVLGNDLPVNRSLELSRTLELSLLNSLELSNSLS